MPRKFSDDNAEVTQNEGVFQQLLSAAFVVQQHNDQVKSSPPDPSEFRAADLSEIAETQNLIRNQQLDLISAANVIVSKAMKIAHADGGAIALASKDDLSYIASDGVAARSAGSAIPLDQSLSAACIRTGQFVTFGDLKKAPQAQSEFFRSQAVQGFAAVPVQQEQAIAGVLELYFLKANAVNAAGLRTCQLLAGLLTGTVASRTGPSAASTQAEISPLDQKSQLDRMVDEEDGIPDLVRSSLPPDHERTRQQDHGLPHVPAELAMQSVQSPLTDHSPQEVVRCRKCGCPLDVSESFCGLCGTSRNPEAAKTSKSSVPPEIAAPPQKPDPVKEQPPSALSASLNSKADLPRKSEDLPAELKEILARFPEEQVMPAITRPATPKDLLLSTTTITEAVPAASAAAPIPSEHKLVPALDSPKSAESKPQEITAVDPAKADTALSAAQSGKNAQWQSANETKVWLESVQSPKTARRWLFEYRANLYLAAAILLLILVLLGVGIPNNSGPRQLGWFDSLLVDLGLAETPATPTYAGNPSTKVWVDTHTALYYCPGSDSYGKTQGGKFESQREAQQDQFEPALRQACP